MDICSFIEKQNESMVDWVLELRYAMVEEVGNDPKDQVKWVDYCIQGAIADKHFLNLAALALLREAVVAEAA